MQETIMVPLDGSGAAEIVLPYAADIAARLNAEIILVSVSESHATDIDHLYLSYLERIRTQVQEQFKDYGAKEEPKVYEEVLLGKPADEILRYADEAKVGLIAMASRGSSGRGPWLLGNIVAKVLRATSRPVLLIRTPASSAALQQKQLVKRILVPLDGSTIGEAALPHTGTLAAALGAEVVLFHVLEPQTSLVGHEDGAAYVPIQDEAGRKASAIAYLDKVGKPLKERGCNTLSAVGFDSPADRIIEYAEANSIDLIAMSTHGRSGIGRWVFGSVTDKILHAGNTAVLVVPAAKA